MPLYLQQPHSPQSVCTAMHPSLDREKAISIAVNLLKHKSPRITQALKDLLTFIPNPNYTKDVLEAAVIKLIYTYPQSQSIMWLFQYPDVVKPHIQVREIIVQELTQKLLSWGCTLEDFSFTADHSLKMSEDTKRSLLSLQLEVDDEPVRALICDLLML